MGTSDDESTLVGYTYYVFISHTTKDEAWAKWLQWELEHFRIPEKVRDKYRGLPARIRPVFWYKNDLAGTQINCVKRELEQSKYMIVICSPTSAHKEWVNVEVGYFKDELKRGDRIIPFIVDGDIKASDQEHICLPMPIRQLSGLDELRCVDVRKYGKHNALVNIVATLLNIRYDILLDRIKREQQRRLVTYCTVFSFLAAVIFGFWDYFFHTKYDYFIDMEDCNGMPTGIIPIKDNDADNYYRLYRFEKRSGLLRRVVYVDCDGNPQDHTNTELADRPCIQELSYNNGELAAIACKNATNRTLYIMHLAKNKLAADLKDEDENQGANFIFSSTSVDQGKSAIQQSTFLDQFLKSPSKIARYIYERDEEGYIKRKLYARHNGENEIGMDANGISGFEYERDSLHRVVRIRFLDKNHQYRSNDKGVAGKKYNYDRYGNLTIAEYVDQEGRLKYNEHHWARAIDTYDSNGYLLDERLFGADGEPCISVQGYHRMTVSNDENREIRSYYDIHDKPTYTFRFGQDPGGYAMTTTIKNKQGQVVEVLFQDANGNLCNNQYRVAINKFEYNDNGLVSDIRNYGTDRQPCVNISGSFHEKFSYNSKGDITEISYYNSEEKAAHNILGIHKFKAIYDKNHRIIEIHAYNMENLPVVCYLFNGAAWLKFDYEGSSEWISEISFFGFDNKPTNTTLGAKVCCERDRYGQITTYKYYNKNYKLNSNRNHCAIMKIEYNDLGLDTRHRFYDENNNPTLLYGAFQINKFYTPTGQVEKICYCDTMQLLKNGPDGWAMQVFNYKNGVISSISFYGENKERVEVKGVHQYRYDIDDCGYTIDQCAYNKELTPTTDMQIGAHKVVNLYDDKRRNIGQDFYDDMNKMPFVRIRVKLNQRGMKTEQTAYNANMELLESSLNFGVAKLQSNYDSQNRITYKCATDKNGKKMNTTDGYAEAYFSYDNDIYEVVYLDYKGELTNNSKLSEPYAYAILYMTPAGQRLYSKIIAVSHDNTISVTRNACCFDLLTEDVLKTIRCDFWQVEVYDVVNNQGQSYYRFSEEYDQYVHCLDSIQESIELKYGKPQFFHYVKQ